MKLYTGGYEESGIGCFTFDGKELKEEFVLRGTENPSFLEIHPTQKYLYCVNELESRARFSSFKITETGVEPVNSAEDEGEALCHLCVHPHGKAIYGACYGSGNILAFKLKKDGRLGEKLFNVFYDGNGVHPRQDCSRIHQVLFDRPGERLVVVDFGRDLLLTYTLDEQGAVIEKSCKQSKLPPGQGPRHLVFDNEGNRAFVITELGNAVLSLMYSKGEFTLTGNICLVNDKISSGGEIALSEYGNRLYASVRGIDEIFALDISDGLRLMGCFKSGGKSPRMFSLCNNYIFCANQQSNNVSVIRLNDNGLAEEYLQSVNVPQAAFCKMW